MNSSSNDSGSAKYSKSSIARGRIAEVLAQARASLKEPSRPYTPSSLDQRTSLPINSTPGAAHNSPKGRNKLRVSQQRFGHDSFAAVSGVNNASSGSSSYPISNVHLMLKENFRQQTNSSSTAAVHQDSQCIDYDSTSGAIATKDEIEKVMEQLSLAADSNSSSSLVSAEDQQGTTLKKKSSSSFQLFLKDLHDHVADLEFMSMELSTDNSLSMQQTAIRLMQKIDRILHPIERLNKHLLKAGTRFDRSTKADVEEIITTLTSIAQRLAAATSTIQNLQEEVLSDAALLLLRPLIRFYLACLKSNYCSCNAPADVTIVGRTATDVDSFVAFGVKICTQSIFQIRNNVQQQASQPAAAPSENVVDEKSHEPVQQNDDDSASSSESSDDDSDDAYDDVDEAADIDIIQEGNASNKKSEQSDRNDKCNQSRSNDSHSSSTGKLRVGDHTPLGGAEVILEFLTYFWSQLPQYLDAFLSATSERQQEESTSPIVSSAAFIALIESAAFAAGLLRCVSVDDVDRRRLIHCATVEIIAQGITILETHRTLRMSLRESLKLRGSNSNWSNQEKEHELVLITEKLVQLLTQLLGAVRNFALEHNGRKQLLRFEIVRRLCTMQRIYQGYPDVLLNCARVTAKLSLLDPFRAEINSKPVHIKCLVDVIIGEGLQCHRIMEGESIDTSQSYGNEELSRPATASRSSAAAVAASLATVEWPSWHTWPLLSRVSFTLGNLTTSNNTNRKLIGAECKVLKPLVILLQACAGSLTQLKVQQHSNQSRKSSKHRSADENDDCESKGSAVMSDDDSNLDAQDDDEDDGTAELELREATVKLLRLLANLSIDSEVGQALASRNETLAILLELFICARDGDDKEEMLLNVIAACTNVSFYNGAFMNKFHALSNPDPQDVKIARKMDKQLVALSAHLSHCLFHENDEIVLETARVLGNLTQHQSVRTSLLTNRTDEALILLLGHINADILTAVTGTLVNLSADTLCQSALLKPSSHLTSAFSELLRRVSFKDISLSTLVCQVLHNLLSSHHSSLNQSHERPVLNEESDATCVTESIRDSLLELSECAMDLSIDENDQYASFARVATAVLKILPAVDIVMDS